MNLSDFHTVQALLSRRGFRFSHSLGQNFIVNPEVCPRMAELCGAGRQSGVLEIGPGVGVLTCELAKRAGRVTAVELDRRLEPVLRETLAGSPNVELVWGDAMKMDLAALIRERLSGQDAYLCANLPYYITSPLIMRVLEERMPVRAMTVMVQKEAAERLCAEPGTRACGAVSAAVRYYADPAILFSVSRSCFFPVPKVDSAVVRMDLRPGPPAGVRDEKEFFTVVKAAFAMRRKTAVNSISARLGLPKERMTQIFTDAGIAPAARAEQLTMENFAALAEALHRERVGSDG